MAVDPRNQDFRQQRLADAIARYGDENALGKALGYKNGAFIRQMKRGLRPVSEKTVAQIEALAGMLGWFDDPSDEPLQLSAEERAMVLTFRQQLRNAPTPAPFGARPNTGTKIVTGKRFRATTQNIKKVK